MEPNIHHWMLEEYHDVTVIHVNYVNIDRDKINVLNVKYCQQFYISTSASFQVCKPILIKKNLFCCCLNSDTL